MFWCMIGFHRWEKATVWDLRGQLICSRFCGAVKPDYD